MYKPSLLAAALAALLPPIHASAQEADTQEQSLPAVNVTASPFAAPANAQILTPAKVLSGDELHDKLGSSLGETLSHELGVSASTFGAGASRPVIRGMEGPRVKILQNGMAVSDVSAISNDHAVAAEAATARQIEILRGPAALLYGSGAVGGLVNVVNERIPTELVPKPTGEAEARFGSANREKSLSFSTDGASGRIGLHADGNLRRTSDYDIPGRAVQSDPASPSGTLPSSYSRAASLGLGGSLIESWGHVGISAGIKQDRYGIPTDERSFIEMRQHRLDADALIKQPWRGIDEARVKLGYTDYQHTEFEQSGTPATRFTNRALETRVELAHAPLSGWRGRFGLQSEDGRFAALAQDGGMATVPATHSTSVAAFVVEERDFGPLRASLGGRIESVRRNPTDAFQDRQFTLASYSAGGLWRFAPGYAAGASVSIAQRAPSTEELYSNGPHESTATYDIGDPNLQKERSRNLELSLQKTEGKLRWKANLFHNRIRNFVYGRFDGTQVDENGIAGPGAPFSRRFWSSGTAQIRGVEAEIGYNGRGPGWSARLFGDASRGSLEGGGNLPLQPATRFGTELAYRQGAWRSGVSVLHALRQNRLANSETAVTPSYTQVDANLSFTQYHGDSQLTWFLLGRNLLNQDIRLSTSTLREVAPLPGRSILVGARTAF